MNHHGGPMSFLSRFWKHRLLALVIVELIIAAALVGWLIAGLL